MENKSLPGSPELNALARMMAVVVLVYPEGHRGEIWVMNRSELTTVQPKV